MNDMVRVVVTDDHVLRLPEGFRFDSNWVSIRREGRRVFLEPIYEDQITSPNIGHGDAQSAPE